MDENMKVMFNAALLPQIRQMQTTDLIEIKEFLDEELEKELARRQTMLRQALRDRTV